jgi:hypothetical protein
MANARLQRLRTRQGEQCHGRREFVNLADHFPAECERVLETIKVVYKNELDTVKQKMPPEKGFCIISKTVCSPWKQ